MSARNYDACFVTPRDDVYVAVTLSDDSSALSQLDFLPQPAAVRRRAGQCETLAALGVWVDEYFSQAKPRATLPLHVVGTPFQRRVWAALCDIEYGRTRQYGELARVLGTSARAVGNACRTNPVALVVPCHRVVARANVGGYSGAISGWKLSVKQWLLAHESDAR